MNDPGQLKSAGTAQKSSRLRWLAGVLIVLLFTAPIGIYAWRYVYNPCEVEDVEQASAFLVGQLKTYDQVYQVAVTASQTSPDHPVNTLKLIFMDTQEVAVPACLRAARNELLNYMETVILAFQAYRSGEANVKVVDLIRQSNAQYVNFKAELETVNECAPFCLR